MSYRGTAQQICFHSNIDRKIKLLRAWIRSPDKNGIDACKVLGIAFTTAAGTLIRSREKGLLERSDAIAKLALLAKHGRYKPSITEDARLKLEAKP